MIMSATEIEWTIGIVIATIVIVLVIVILNNGDRNGNYYTDPKDWH